MQKRVVVLGIVFMLVCGLSNAAPVTLTFEDGDQGYSFPGATGLVPNGYGGLNWHLVYYTWEFEDNNPTANNVADCPRGNVVWSQSGDFDFISADLTARYGSEGITLDVLGLDWNDERTILERSYLVTGIELSNGTWDEQHLFEFESIDTLLFMPHGNVKDQTFVYLGIDDMEINPPVVPIPATLLLFGSSLLGLLGFRRIRQ